MHEKVWGSAPFCLIRETFADRFIRNVARRVNFIALVARAHRLAEAIAFLDELRHALGGACACVALPTEGHVPTLKGRRPFMN